MQEMQAREADSIPGLGRSPGGGNGNPLQYSCLEKSHGQRSLVGYSPWDRKELDTTEQLSTHSPLPIPWQLLMYFLSMYLSVVDIWYKWNHTVCELLCLASFTQHVQFSPMLCMYQCLISFSTKILFCCVAISHCNYLFIRPLVFTSFTHFDYYVST